MKTWIAIVAVLVPAWAGATGDRIVVMAPTGAAGIKAQLGDTLCVSEECVAPEKVLSAGKLDWAKVSREHVSSVVVGHAIASKKAGPQVELQVLGMGGKVKRSEKLPLNDDNKLAVKDLVTASAVALDSIDAGEAGKESLASPAQAKAPKGKAVAHHSHAKTSHRLASRPHASHARG